MSSSIRFDNRVAIVTGAGKGLGRAYARLLAERGASVIVNNRKHADDTEQASADKVVSEIIEDGGIASSNYEQVEQAAAGTRLLEQTLDEYGRIDILINNAGIAPAGYLTKMSAAEFEHIIAINTYGTINIIRAILPAMKKAKYGKVLLSLSSSGFYGNAGLSAYGASKGALYAFMQSICQEEHDSGVFFNAIAPYADTQLTHSYIPEKLRKALSPEHVAPLAVWLVNDKCDANGQAITAAGGYFRCLQIRESIGIDLSAHKEITPELVKRHFNEIINDEDGYSFDSATAAFQDIATKLS